MIELEGDVVVVGAGVAGALIAERLASAGLKVVLLEAGPALSDRQTHLNRFYEAKNKVPQSPWVPPGDDPHHGMAGSPGVLDTVVPHWRDTEAFHFVQAGELPFSSTYERLAGGTGNHWLGTALRHLPVDFRMKTTYGVGRDWPLSYDDLEPWYSAAEHFLGVAGDHDRWNGHGGAWRSARYPMPGIPPTWLDQIVEQRLQGFRVAGTELEVVPNPQARNSVAYDGRPPCMGNSSCIPICPIEAKYHPSVHLARAVAASDTPTELRTKSVAYRVDVLPGSGEVEKVCFRTWSGEEGVARGARYVLCANAIETAKLLLLSPWKTYRGVPISVANRSDQVGRNLTDHVICLAWGLADRPLHAFRGPLKTSSIDTFRDGSERAHRAAWTMAIGNDGWAWPTGAPNSTVQHLVRDRGLRGQSLRDALADHLSRQIHVTAELESLPREADRVTVSHRFVDKLEIPRPVIYYGLDRYTKSGFAAAAAVLRAVMGQLGVDHTEHLSFAPGYFEYEGEGYQLRGAGHIMGTHRMGADDATSVVNSECRCHDHENLFLVGAGVFPSTGTANPTLTIAALALRTAQTIAGDLGVSQPSLKAASYVPSDFRVHAARGVPADGQVATR